MVAIAKSVLEPVIPNHDDIAQARTIVAALDSLKPRDAKVMIEDESRRLRTVLPVAAVRLLHDLLREMAQGHAVSLVPMHAELTTQQAADALNVSRPHLVKLLDANALPCRLVGTHRRVRYEDLMRFKRAIDAKRLASLRMLSEESEKLGLFD